MIPGSITLRGILGKCLITYSEADQSLLNGFVEVTHRFRCIFRGGQSVFKAFLELISNAFVAFPFISSTFPKYSPLKTFSFGGTNTVGGNKIEWIMMWLSEIMACLAKFCFTFKAACESELSWLKKKLSTLLQAWVFSSRRLSQTFQSCQEKASAKQFHQE